MAHITIDIELNQVHPDIDINTISAYLSAILREQTGLQVVPHIIDSDYVNPIKLAKALNIQPPRMGGGV